VRIISLSPSFTEIIQSIVESDCLVAVTDHCPEILVRQAHHPERSRGTPRMPRIGSPKALNIEGIKALSADLLLVDQNENRPEEIRELEKHFKIMPFDVRSPQAAMDAVWSIGRLLGRTDESGQLTAEIANELEQNKQVFQGQPAVRALILLWNQPYLTVNFDTYISRLVESSGAYNIFHADPIREFAIEIEDMIDNRPEIVFLATDPYPFKKRHIANFRQYRIFSKIPIQLIDGRYFSRFGPNTVEALQFLRNTISSVLTFKPV
jgi:iron complex transport system substrate-binding protein